MESTENALHFLIEGKYLQEKEVIQKSEIDTALEFLTSDDIEKAFGKKDISKLQKKEITNKQGEKQTVYVSNGQEEDGEEKKPKSEEKKAEPRKSIGSGKVEVGTKIVDENGKKFRFKSAQTLEFYGKDADSLHFESNGKTFKVETSAVKDFEDKFGESSGEAKKVAEGQKEAPKKGKESAAAEKPEQKHKGAEIIDLLKGKLKDFAEKEKAFFKEGQHLVDSEARKKFAEVIKKKTKGIIKVLKHEVEEIKTAGVGIKKLVSGKKLDEHEKKAVKNVAKELALTVGMIVATGGAGHLAHGVGKASAGIVMHYFQHTGLKAVAKSLAFAKAEGEEDDTDEILTKLIEGLCEYIQSGEIPDEEWVQIMEESGETNKILGLDKHLAQNSKEMASSEKEGAEKKESKRKELLEMKDDSEEGIEKAEQKDYAYKNYMGKSLGYKRENMPQIDPNDLDTFLMHYSGKKTKISKIRRKLKDLKPTQDDINDYKILEKIKNKEDWKGRKFIISLDGYMLDAHHSWAQGLEFDPEQEVECYRVNLPIKKLVHRTKRLKISTKKDIHDNEIEKGKRTELVTVHGKTKTFTRRQVVGTNEEEKSKEKPKKAKQEKAPRKPQWYDKYLPMNLNRLPVGIPENKVTIWEGDTKNHWVMSWYDEKQGRNQFAYTREFLQRNAENKWAKIKSIKSSQIDLIRKQTTKYLVKTEDDKKKQAAAIIHIISVTGLRPGDKMLFKRTKNRGVSTLSPDNIEIKGSKVKFNFIGKSYQENNAEIDNKEVADYLKKLKKERKGEEFLFDVDKKGIMNTFREELGFKGLKLKDMRTYVATDEARKILQSNKLPPPPVPEGGKGMKKLLQDKLKTCFELVSQKLNNTPAMAKSSYIHPAVIEDFIVGLGFKKEDILKKSEEEEVVEKDKMLDGIISKTERYGKKTYAQEVSEEEDEDLDITFPLPTWWSESED